MNPIVGREVKINRQVNVFVSKGVETVELWDLSHKSEEEALNALMLQDMQVTVNALVFSDMVKKGHVVTQFPSANTIIEKGATCR